MIKTCFEFSGRLNADDIDEIADLVAFNYMRDIHSSAILRARIKYYFGLIKSITVEDEEIDPTSISGIHKKHYYLALFHRYLTYKIEEAKKK